MAELSTIARPYAEALFEVSGADTQSTDAWLERLAAVAAEPQLQAFASNPKVTPEQVIGLLADVNGQPLPDRARNLLGALLDNDRLAALPAIAQQFRALANARSGTSEAVIHSAFPIDDATLKGVQAALERRFGRKLDVSVQLDPALIGGIRVNVGDEVLDTSVKARLEQMKTVLAA